MKTNASACRARRVDTVQAARSLWAGLTCAVMTCSALVCLGGLRPTAALALEPQNPSLSADAREILNFLEATYGSHSLMGYNVYPHTPDLYEQTGRHGAVWSRDLVTETGWETVAAEVLARRYLLTLHWHWPFDGQSAWKSERTTQVDVGACVTPGTPEYTQLLLELDDAADRLQVLEDAGVPVLFRPLHEIDGGWFWWTDAETPENTAALFRLLYDHLTYVRGLDNLIWVFNAATGTSLSAEQRARFYPGGTYTDLATIDLYDIDFEDGVASYQSYFETMAQVAPDKLLGLGECQAVPDPDKMAGQQTPAWLYALPWWGPPFYGHTVDWALHETRSEFMLTLEELPPLGQGNISPDVGILWPEDSGMGRFNAGAPQLELYASDRDGSVSRVELFADGQPIGVLPSPPFTFTWSDAPPGSYSITAKAYDTQGVSTSSNTVHISSGVADLAFGRPVTVSSGGPGASVVDGSLYTIMTTDVQDANPDDQWVMVDLGDVFTIDQVHTYWGWKIHPEDYTLDVCVADPSVPSCWVTVKSVQNRPWTTWKATFRDTFSPTSARYVRIHMLDRAASQNWGGYSLSQLEVPVPLEQLGDNDVPVFTQQASADPADVWEYQSVLTAKAEDPDREYLTYAWSVLEGPADGVTFSVNHSIFASSPSAVFSREGAYVLRCSASDGRGGQTHSDVSLQVHSVTGSRLTDDRSSQSGNGLGELDTLSKWNLFALRFILERGDIESARLRVYRRAGDTAPITLYAHSGTSDVWNELEGPVPGKGELLASTALTSGGQWADLDVTAFVASQARGDGIATFVLVNNQDGWNTQVHTRQNPINPPTLELTFVAPPCDNTDNGGQPYTFYLDFDGDGYGDALSPVEACEVPADAALSSDDCDDADGAIHPGALDDCGDGLDMDCDGTDGALDAPCLSPTPTLTPEPMPTGTPTGTPTAPTGTPTTPTGTPTAPTGTPTAPTGTPTAPTGTPTAQPSESPEPSGGGCSCQETPLAPKSAPIVPLLGLLGVMWGWACRRRYAKSGSP